MMLLVFRVSISFCTNRKFLAISFSMTEIACWSVSMTSTISASDLLKFFRFFGSHGPWLQIALVLNGKLVDTVGDMLVDLTQSDLYFVERFLARDIVDYGDLLCASASIEPVRKDLELMNVVHHCRNLVALLVSFTSARSPHVCGARLPPASPLPA